MSTQNTSGAIKKLIKFGDAALRPQLVNGRWRKPQIPPRYAARIRKDSIVSGTYGAFCGETGVGWDPAWDSPGRIGTTSALRPPKLHKNYRDREQRATDIESLLDGMDERIDKFRKEKDEKKPSNSIETLYKKMMRRKR
mmetsp:Transcript_16843/g.33540  ORF Transcript_16843/g.33540 Transcript_16843/m.33540 type:complete len:139 (+) Transcript_16843:208-624(+)|eukprot:CAMPEP_0194281002 /NCGR_PEP_ID=MMETSP0169-20130528/19466_1 /TAXON_ID=218684 /ORGANISM="Corethron pennatum, Strain L29A3" /LENGTH=138 /DNA_ID=CAMNT_0039025927 /DNA_START=271 /DNA_END=687 /DNA_ORIENTATION=+